MSIAIKMDWEECYSRLLAFKKEHGHLRLPNHHPAFGQLSEWISHQQTNHTSLEPAQVRALLNSGIYFGRWETEWYHNFFDLQDYVHQHGDIPRVRSPLARWLEYQKHLHNRGKMPAQRIRWLNTLGIVWKVDVFAEHLAEIKAFRAKHGHCKVPCDYPENPTLGHYVSFTLRGSRRQLSPGEIKQLEEIDFVWDLREDAWQRNFSELIEFIDKHDAFPTKLTHLRLSKWAGTQRKHAQSPERIRQLDEVGFPWDPREERWLARYFELKAFQRDVGHCRVPADDKKYIQLWKWLHFQKTRKKFMPAGRRKLLNALEIDWSIEERASTDDHMEELEAFYRKNGHCNVTIPDNKPLSCWLFCVRRRRDRLPAETIKRLEAMNIDWNPAITFWNRRYEEAAAFWKRFGHCRMPVKWPENPKLPTWVYTQKRRWNKLSEERRQRLAAIGMGGEQSGPL